MNIDRASIESAVLNAVKDMVSPQKRLSITGQTRLQIGANMDDDRLNGILRDMEMDFGISISPIEADSLLTEDATVGDLTALIFSKVGAVSQV